MNKKRSATAIVIILFLLITSLVVYIFSELYSEEEKQPKEEVYRKDALKFKNEYESINDDEIGENRVRILNIPKDNPFIYKTADDIVEMTKNNETFIVYFGFASCPWCRSILSSLIETAKNNKIDTIYYVDVLNIRDKYELDSKNKAVRTVEGTDAYYELLKLYDSVLSDYSPLTYTKNKKTIKVSIKEKRIYAPNIIVVKNGAPIVLETGISSKQEDAYQELTEEILCEVKEKFNCLLEKFKNNDDVCNINDPVC